MSIGRRAIRHAKRRLCIAIAPKGIRRPAAGPGYQTRGGVEDRRSVIPRNKLCPNVDERRG